MESSQNESSLNESVAQVMQTLPPPIRNYLTQGKYTVVAKGLMAKYGLRIDQAGVLEREIMLLLMGIDNPDEFAASLKSDASLADDVIRNIMGDVNQQIFVPLRDEMRKAGAMPPSAPSGRGSEIPGVKPEPGPGQPKSYFHLQNKIPIPVSTRPVASRPASPAPPAAGGRGSLRDVLASITKTPGSINNSMLLEDHEEPHIEFHKAPASPTSPRPMVPPPSPASLPHTSAPVPSRPVPPPNLPGVVQPHIIPPGGRPDVTFPKLESAVAPKPVPPAASTPAKPYAADPYREPIEP